MKPPTEERSFALGARVGRGAGAVVRVIALAALGAVAGCGDAEPAAGEGDDLTAAQWTRESELPAKFDKTILPYFFKHGRFGEFAGVGGVPIRYATFEQENERGALVVVNGRTESYVKYAEFVYDFRKLGYSIYLIDHRGQGFSGRMLSDPDKGYVEHFDDYLADLDTFLTTVVDARAHARRFALAHSLGGGITIRYAEKHPEAFDAIALSSPMAMINFKSLLGESASTDETAVHLLAAAQDLIGNGDDYAIGQGPYDPNKSTLKSLTHSEVRYGIWKDLRHDYPAIALGGATYRWIKESIEADRDLRDHANLLKAPLLMLEAAQDTVVRPEGEDVVCAKAAQCTKVVLPESRHEPIIESDATRKTALDAIRDFFAHQASAH